VTWDTSQNEDDGADGWTLTLHRRASLLRVEQHRNQSEAPIPPFCGIHGILDGEYLPARLVPEPVRAWKTVGNGDPAPSQR
jgi:hypothetical protein